MSISKSEILQKLPAFNNFGKVLVKDQGTNDIIKAIVKAHDEYKSDYDKICSLFYTGEEIETAKNIFNYLKKNVRYVIESDNLQQIKSPSAIFATPSSDCKNYALAINGILDACRRKYGLNCDLYFRFAAYDGTRTPQHVFSVMVINGEEIWIDPVLNYFNEDKAPNYFKDKKINNMALMALNGIDPYANIQTSQQRSMAAIPPPPMLNLSNASGLNTSRPPSGFSLNNLLGSNGGGISNLLQSGSLASAALSLLPGGAIVQQILPQLEKIFPNIKKTDPLVDPANTEYGRRTYLDRYPDIKNSRFASQPFQHFAEFGASEGRYWTENPSVTIEAIDDYYSRYPDTKNYSSSILQHYINYGQSEGRSIKLNLTPSQQAQINAATNSNYQSPSSPLLPGGGEYTPSGPGLPGTPQTQTAGISPLIILALVGAGAAMFLRKK